MTAQPWQGLTRGLPRQGPSLHPGAELSPPHAPLGRSGAQAPTDLGAGLGSRLRNLKLR